MTKSKKRENTAIVAVVFIVVLAIAIAILGQVDAKAETVEQFNNGLYVYIAPSTQWTYTQTLTQTSDEEILQFNMVYNGVVIGNYRTITLGPNEQSNVHPQMHITAPVAQILVTIDGIYIPVNGNGVQEGNTVYIGLERTNENGTLIYQSKQFVVQKRVTETDVNNAYNDGYEQGQESNSTLWGFFIELGNAVANVFKSFFQWQLFGVNISNIVFGVLTVAMVYTVVKMLI